MKSQLSQSFTPAKTSFGGGRGHAGSGNATATGGISGSAISAIGGMIGNSRPSSGGRPGQGQPIGHGGGSGRPTYKPRKPSRGA